MGCVLFHITNLIIIDKLFEDEFINRLNKSLEVFNKIVFFKSCLDWIYRPRLVVVIGLNELNWSIAIAFIWAIPASNSGSGFPLQSFLVPPKGFPLQSLSQRKIYIMISMKISMKINFRILLVRLTLFADNCSNHFLL